MELHNKIDVSLLHRMMRNAASQNPRLARFNFEVATQVWQEKGIRCLLSVTVQQQRLSFPPNQHALNQVIQKLDGGETIELHYDSSSDDHQGQRWHAIFTASQLFPLPDDLIPNILKKNLEYRTNEPCHLSELTRQNPPNPVSLWACIIHYVRYP